MYTYALAHKYTQSFSKKNTFDLIIEERESKRERE